MPNTQSRQVNASAYILMCQSINRVQNARWHMTIAGITTIAIFIATLLSNLRYGAMYALGVALPAALVWLGLAIGTFFAHRGLGYGASEEKLLSVALEFLRSVQYKDAILETIKARAEISTTVGPVRSLIPILLIPLIVSLLDALGAMPVYSWLVIALILEVLLFPLALDTYWANIDGVIRHAIAEYKCEQTVNQSQLVHDKDQQFLVALLTSDIRCSHPIQERVER